MGNLSGLRGDLSEPPDEKWAVEMWCERRWLPVHKGETNNPADAIQGALNLSKKLKCKFRVVRIQSIVVAEFDGE